MSPQTGPREAETDSRLSSVKIFLCAPEMDIIWNKHMAGGSMTVEGGTAASEGVQP